PEAPAAGLTRNRGERGGTKVPSVGALPLAGVLSPDVICWGGQVEGLLLSRQVESQFCSRFPPQRDHLATQTTPSRIDSGPDHSLSQSGPVCRGEMRDHTWQENSTSATFPTTRPIRTCAPSSPTRGRSRA